MTLETRCKTTRDSLADTENETSNQTALSVQ